jgi:hypothetical protein
MKFKVDENLPIEIAEDLRLAGSDSRPDHSVSRVVR